LSLPFREKTARSELFRGCLNKKRRADYLPEQCPPTMPYRSFTRRREAGNRGEVLSPNMKCGGAGGDEVPQRGVWGEVAFPLKGSLTESIAFFLIYKYGRGSFDLAAQAGQTQRFRLISYSFFNTPTDRA
jgi:hypothetical protein